MSARRDRVIRAWLRWNTDSNLRPTAGILHGKLDAHHNRIRWWNEGTIARYENGAVRLALPNFLTHPVLSNIRRIARAEGIPTYFVPDAVLDRADVIGGIEVLDVQSKAPYLRPTHSLLRTRVRARNYDVRTAYFLAGYDKQERNSFFFCEVSGEPKTIEEAYEALVPESVRIARAQGRKVLRQGDMFFISASRDEVPGKGPARARFSWEKPTHHYLFGSNHTVTELVKERGIVLVRGSVKHRPLGRRPDHRPLRLPLGWWIAVQNAVPIAAQTRSSKR